MELPIIYFEGEKCKPGKNGYLCPYQCGDPRFSRRKWKTEAGFKKHMEECPKRPSLLQRKKDNEEIEHSAFLTLKKEALGMVQIMIGDVIPVVKEIIIKGIYEWRGNRQVRVRYEAVKRFEAREIEVKEIDILTTPYCRSAKDLLNYITINKEYLLTNVCETMESAKSRAVQMQRDYDASVQFAADCR